MERITKRESTILPEVLKAIASLKGKTGSSPKSIGNYLRRKKNFQNVSEMQLGRAIKYGQLLSFIKHRGGKYFLIMDKNNYETYRTLGIKIGKYIKNCRRGRKGCSRKRGKQERGRGNGNKSSEQNESGQKKAKGTSEPKKKGQKASKKGGRQGKRQSKKVSQEKGGSKGAKNDQLKTGKNEKKDQPKQNGKNPPKPCNNPECLCGLQLLK